MIGRSAEESKELAASTGLAPALAPHFEMPGNHPHSTIVMDAVTPATLGALVAAYEHKTYFLSVLMGLNAFDQWGVELGKVIAGQMQSVLSGTDSEVDLDPATLAAAAAWRAANID